MHGASRLLTFPCSFKCSSSFLILQVFVLGRKGLFLELKSLCSHFSCTFAQRSRSGAVQHRNTELPWLWHRTITGRPVTSSSYFLHRFSVKRGEENDSDVFRHTVTSTIHTLVIHLGIQWISALNSLSVTLQESKAKKSPDLLYLKGSRFTKMTLNSSDSSFQHFRGLLAFLVLDV